MNNPFKSFTKKEWLLWIISLVIVTASNLLSADTSVLTLSAALIGVTSLVFAAIGNAWAQVLMIIFSILYGIISYRFRYWGEMITYLGMSLPMAVWSLITWVKHPSKDNGNNVEIRSLTRKNVVLLVISGAVVTALFYFVLDALGTPNMLFSTVSVTTSFMAASLTMLRSPYYAVGYALNDLVLIVLWVLASVNEPVYIPVAVNFTIFFFNDMYGFVSWKKRAALQS